MARQAKSNIRTKTARLKLAARREPYYTQLTPGLTLGYRRLAAGAGIWIRRELRDGDYLYADLGVADDAGPADGKDVLTFEQAAKAATAPIAPVGAPITIERAAELYLTGFEARSKHAKDARQRINKWILPKLGKVRIDRLTKAQGETLRDSMVRDDPDDPDVKRRSQDSANRILTIFKAICNHAFADDANNIPTDKAWRMVKPFRDVGAAREDDFDPAEVRKLIAEAAKTNKPFANLCEAGYLTGARIGELAQLLVRHFDADRALLLIPDGKTGARPVTLSAEGVAFFRKLTQNRPDNAILLPRADGDAWGKSEQHRPFKAAAKAAGLSPSASFYTLRHSHISRAIEANMPLSLIAENCGTSLLMIQKNYAHVLAKTRKSTIDATAPKLRRVK